MDPHLLLGVHGLETAEALGEAMAEAAAAESEETETEEVRRYSETEDYAVSLELLVSHMQSIRAMLLRRGFVAEGEGYRPGWRMAGITARQVETIKRAGRCTRHIPREHRGAVKTLKSVPYALSRGEASDLLDVLYGGYRYAQEVAVGDAVYRAQWPAEWVPLPSAEVRTAAGDVLRGEK